MADALRFAVLIDADNVSDQYIGIILDEITGEGIATNKRIYGDWTHQHMSSWKSVLLDNSLTPIQQYAYTLGKNATDSAMIIDAMDILYSDHVDGFCLVSSDSDFTRLAMRLRESGKVVVGMGESKTPRAFIAACDKFRYLDILLRNQRAQNAAPPSKNGNSPTAATAAKQQAALEASPEAKPLTDLATIRTALANIVEERSDEDGWVFSGTLGNILLKRYPDFDVRNFGYQKMTPFIQSLGIFELKSKPGSEDGSIKLYYVRLKPQEKGKPLEKAKPAAAKRGTAKGK